MTSMEKISFPQWLIGYIQSDILSLKYYLTDTDVLNPSEESHSTNNSISFFRSEGMLSSLAKTPRFDMKNII